MSKLFAKHIFPYGDTGSGLGFGAMGITAFYGDPLPDEQAHALLKAVYDAGCRHFDTAEIYVSGEKFNEKVLGDFFQTVPRDSYSVATKYWPADDDKGEYDDIKAHLTASLERLQLDYVDLYYSHRVKSIEGGINFAKAANKLKEKGLIKEVGLSEVSGKWLREINKVCPIDAVQQEWSLLTRSLEAELVPVCKELNITIVAYSPLARNLLATKVETPPDDWRATLERYSKENLEKNQKIHDTVQGLATKYDCTTAQLSLAWLFHKAQELGVHVIPIPGSTKQSNALSNLGATKVTISDEDSTILEDLANQVAGQRGNDYYTSLGTIEEQMKS